MTCSGFLEIAQRLTPLFSTAGFVIASQLVDPVSDNGLVEMKGDDVVLRLVRDRNQWFVEMRSTNADEWFDSRYVLAALGDTQTWLPPTDEAGLRTFVQHLLSRASHWQLLFHPSVYEQTKLELNAKELLSARERFNYTPKG